MTTNQIIILVAVLAIVALLAARVRGGGPRVTEIDRTTTREKNGDDGDER